MAEFFERLQDNATIDNYLSGTTRAPKGAETKSAARPPAPGSPTMVR
jgi:hypothetical protein